MRTSSWKYVESWSSTSTVDSMYGLYWAPHLSAYVPSAESAAAFSSSTPVRTLIPFSRSSGSMSNSSSSSSSPSWVTRLCRPPPPSSSPKSKTAPSSVFAEFMASGTTHQLYERSDDIFDGLNPHGLHDDARAFCRSGAQLQNFVLGEREKPQQRREHSLHVGHEGRLRGGRERGDGVDGHELHVALWALEHIAQSVHELVQVRQDLVALLIL
eukprot:scaffold118_cov382-Prasinococcus_capsulatus_cf.AAC.3